MTEIRNVQPDLPDYDRILALYEQTFPENERIPWEMLMRSAARDGIHFRACYEDGLFVGFYDVSATDRAVFLLYLAVPDELRGHGYGSRILGTMKTEYSGRMITVNVEPQNEKAENREQREARLRFYRRNGFYETGYSLIDEGDRFSILSSELPFREDAYREAVNQLSGGAHPFTVARDWKTEPQED